MRHRNKKNPNRKIKDSVFVDLFSKDKFARKRLNLAKPEFYVFYNGQDDFPSISEMKLSDSFNESNNCQIELITKVFNLNKFQDISELEKCKSIIDYAKFIKIVTEEQKNGGDYIKRAIILAKKKNILNEYLNRKSSEVMNMLLGEYDYKLDMKMRFEEGLEQGTSNVLNYLKEGHSIEETLKKFADSTSKKESNNI